MKEKVILGLDISTQSVGVAVVSCFQDFEYPIKLSNAFKLDNKLSLEERAEQLNKQLEHINSQYDIQSIYVEEPIVLFKGGSHAKTVAILQRFNGMVCYIIYKIFNKCPYMVNSTSARSKLGIKILKGKKNKKEKKQPIIDFIADKFKNTKTPFLYSLTKKGNFQVGTDDAADALVVALVGPMLRSLIVKEKEDVL